MKKVLFTAIIGAALVAALQLTVMLGNFTGGFGGFLFYAPMLVYFGAIYFAVKGMKSTLPDHILPFKTGLKAGGLAALIICFVWGISFFVGLTHTDVKGFVDYKIANNQTAEIEAYLNAFSSRQHMFDMTKFWVMPNFLLGFLITVLATVLQARRKS